MYKAVTIGREFGSGGGEIARQVADRMGWKLLDRTLTLEIARTAKVDPSLARRYDEQVDSWMHRVSRRALWHGAFEGVAAMAETDVFDAETVAALSRSLVKEACDQGQCVIVGRGGVCLLQDRPDVFHVFIYAPWQDKVARIKQRFPEATNIEEIIQATEKTRNQYLKLHFGCNRTDPHLYDLMISSGIGLEAAASVIINAVSAVNESGRDKA
jgi:cytidylate kinase